MVAEVLLSDYLSSPTPYNRKQNVSSASLNKTVLPSSYKPLTVGVSISIHCGRNIPYNVLQLSFLPKQSADRYV